MNIQIFGKAKCFDTKKAERYFKERGIRFQRIDLDKSGISKGELASVKAAVGGLDALVDDRHPDAALLRYLAYEEDKEKAAAYVEVLYNQALIIADLPLPDPARYAELVCGLMK